VPRLAVRLGSNLSGGYDTNLSAGYYVYNLPVPSLRSGPRWYDRNPSASMFDRQFDCLHDRYSDGL
jgi:hypothetical protein